jgi:hypothetical protein
MFAQATLRLWYTLLVGIGFSAGLLPAGQSPMTDKCADIIAQLRAVDEQIARGWSATLFVTRNDGWCGDNHSRFRVTADATRAAIWVNRTAYLTLPPFVPNSPFIEGTSLKSRPVQKYMLKDLHSQLNASYTEWEALTTTASGEIIEQVPGGTTLLLYPMHIDSFAMDEGEILLVGGRGYGRYLKRVLEQKRSKDGLLHLRAEGWLDDPDSEGEWRLTIEPRTLLVRSAEFFTQGQVTYRCRTAGQLGETVKIAASGRLEYPGEDEKSTFWFQVEFSEFRLAFIEALYHAVRHRVERPEAGTEIFDTREPEVRVLRVK